MRTRLVADMGAITLRDARRLEVLHWATFGDSAEWNPEADAYAWWIVGELTHPAAFASAYVGIGQQSDKVCMFSRCGVLAPFRGQGLQRQLIRARLRWGARKGCSRAVTYTIDNTHSEANLRRCGFLPYRPKDLYAGRSANYWQADL